MKQASIVPNVEGFLLWLSGAITQYDQRASKRRGYNPYALGHYLKALDELRVETASIKRSQDPADLGTLKRLISRKFLVESFPPAKRAIKVIDEFLASGKAPNYPGARVRKRAEDLAERVVARFLGENSETWLTQEDIARVCPECATKMASLGIRKVRASVLFGERALVAARWEDMPKGWTEESRKKFWEGLTGDVKHKVTKCIKEMQGKVSDPGAFCASLADRVEGPGWRKKK